jgi:hypothetical protein
MTHSKYSRGLLTRAIEYAISLETDGADESETAGKRLVATCYRESARKLRETLEGGGVPDGATLLDQLADEADPDLALRLSLGRTTRDLTDR